MHLLVCMLHSAAALFYLVCAVLLQLASCSETVTKDMMHPAHRPCAIVLSTVQCAGIRTGHSRWVSRRLAVVARRGSCQQARHALLGVCHQLHLRYKAVHGLCECPPESLCLSMAAWQPIQRIGPRKSQPTITRRGEHIMHQEESCDTQKPHTFWGI